MKGLFEDKMVAVQREVDLRPFNTLRLNSQAAFLMSITNGVQIGKAIEYAKNNKLKVVPLGEGSNVVLPLYWEILCLQMKLLGIKIIEESPDEVCIQVAAGERWHDLVKTCLRKGWYGLENLALIPGSCGAAPIQNIGAYGVEIKEFLSQVHLIDRQNGQSRVVQMSDCGFGYRTSYFKSRWREKYIVTAICLRLSKIPSAKVTYQELQERLYDLGVQKPSPSDVFNAVCSLRSAKLPSIDKVGNVGSFFQNPSVSLEHFNRIMANYPTVKGYKISATSVRVAAASLLEICGWKGFREGNLGIYDKHALCLVNYGTAHKEMILSLSARVQADVMARFSVRLEIEPRIY